MRVLGAMQGDGPARVHQAPAVRWLSVRSSCAPRRRAAGSSSAKYADKRETMATSPREFYRLPAAGEDPRDAVFVDYVADTGDGFNATFATARSCPARPTADSPRTPSSPPAAPTGRPPGVRRGRGLPGGLGAAVRTAA